MFEQVRKFRLWNFFHKRNSREKEDFSFNATVSYRSSTPASLLAGESVRQLEARLTLTTPASLLAGESVLRLERSIKHCYDR